MEFVTFIGGLEMLVFIGIALICLAIPIIALVEVLTNEYKGNDKLIWVLVILLFNFIGAILYFVLGRRTKLPKGL